MSGEKRTALNTMVGGSHYKVDGIQPIEFFHKNPQLDWNQMNMIKYSFRHKTKNGLQDLLKVVHYAMIEAEQVYEKGEEFEQMIKGLFCEKD